MQIAELCTVEPILTSTPSTPQVSTSEDNEDKLDNGSATIPASETMETSTPNKTENSLICLDESKLDFGLTMDNFTLEDIQDDDFDPRALDSSPAPVTPVVSFSSKIQTELTFIDNLRHFSTCQLCFHFDHKISKHLSNYNYRFLWASILI